MARREIDIGVEGNDGTGDSIRESFRKTNENFQQLFAVFGEGGQIDFTALSDTPDELTPSTVPLVDPSGNQLNLVELASNSAVDPNAVDTITFDTSLEGKLIISTAFRRLSDDTSPTLGGPLNTNNRGIAKVAISQSAVNEFNTRYNESITIDDLVITKGFADSRYVSGEIPIRVDKEPEDRSAFIKIIDSYNNGNLVIPSHGFTRLINGSEFEFSSRFEDPQGLTSGQTYFLRFVDADELAVYSNRADAVTGDASVAENNKIFVSGVIDLQDEHEIIDTSFNFDLQGNFPEDVALPRESITRRQGDRMEGPLLLHDHPGDLAGSGEVFGSDDLQAATKFYADNSTFVSTENIYVATSGDDSMEGVPRGSEGRAFNYAFRTINAAAVKAEEIIRTSPPEPGPYFQTVTTNNGNLESEITTAGIVNPQFGQTRKLLQINEDYITAEFINYIKFEFPEFVFDEVVREEQIRNIVNAVAFDINRGLEANFLTRDIAERFYSTKETRRQITAELEQTLNSIGFVQEIAQAILQNRLHRERSVDAVNVDGIRARVETSTNHGLQNGEQILFRNMGGMIEIENQTAFVRVLDNQTVELYEDKNLTTFFDISAYTPYTTGGVIGVVYQPRLEDRQGIKIDQSFDQPDADQAARAAIDAKFDLILNIIENGIDAGPDVIFGNTYKVVLENGSQTFVDQGNPENTDLLPGKIVVGKISGAEGRIVSLTNNDGTENNNDTLQLIQLNGKDFLVGETVKYGNFVKEKQVTIQVESGVYEEDLPIRLSNNVSLRGDEFRRVIVRPKKRVSQSRYAELYFYRDLEFDDISLLDKLHSDVTRSNAQGNNRFDTDDTSWLSIDAPVRFIGANLFGGVVKNTEYYITEFDSNSFSVSETPGGPNLSLSADTGRMYVISSPVAGFLNQTDEVQGYFGRHYLKNPHAGKNVGVIPQNNGNFDIASRVLLRNREFIQTEIINFIQNNIDEANAENDTSSIWFQFSYDSGKCFRDVGLIVDAISQDLVKGGAEFTLEAQGEYFEGSVAGQEQQTNEAIEQIGVIASQLLQGNEPSFDGNILPDLSEGAAESGTAALVSNLVSVVTFAFDSDYNPPLRNDQDGMDVFLMSDATIIRNATVQGHAGFMVVLDPENQILTKSPYIQTGSSFSKSDNAKRFRGGMFIDAFVGNIPARITNVIDPFTLELESDTGQGLFVRPPRLPCPFFVEGIRYQVNAIADYDSGQGTVTIFLDKSSNPDSSGDGQGYLEGSDQEIFLQTAGNRSMLGNDFTQINDLGYGLVVTNGAVSEMVSMFTYYCQAAYYANNGGEIRSLNGSNGYGRFGLISEGADPNEIPDRVELLEPLVFPGKAFTSIDTPNELDEPFIHVTDLKHLPNPNSVITIYHGSNIGVLQYRITNIENLSDRSNDGIIGNDPNDIVASGGNFSDAVFRLSFTPDQTDPNDFFGRLRADVPDGEIVEIRNERGFVFDDVRDPSVLESRPSTAINFDESASVTYRSLGFSTTDSVAQPLGPNQILASVETGFDFINLTVNDDNKTNTDPDDGSRTLGSQQGDVKIAIEPISTLEEQERLLRDIEGRQPGDPGYSGGMIFTFKGKTHQVKNYAEPDPGVAVITIDDVLNTNISQFTGIGLAEGIISEELILRAGLGIGAKGEITISISVLRATGHDFTEIGTGGYNDTNYPSVIFGDPVNPIADFYTDGATATSSQVWERRKGRVFFVSTDQFGFFRVGKFFSVDQGTGSIEFAGEIGLTNANSLGFTRGVTINEFSADDSFADFSGQAVPTERATGGYINRALGYNVRTFTQIQGAPVDNRIGPGFLPLNGDSAMEGTVDMGTNQITNLGLPGTDGTAATNKNYVDGTVQSFDEIENLRNTYIDNVTADNLFVTTGLKRILTTPVSGGTWSIGDTIGTVGGAKTGTVVDINAVVDPIEGTVTEVVYEEQSGTFVIGETLFDQPDEVASATIIDGPSDEFANAQENNQSDINLSVSRDSSGTEFDLQIKPDTILDADVNSAAGILQSKLDMQAADTFDESDPTTGWNGSATKTQADLGLAKFSNENFETKDGFVRIKDNGIVFAELNQIDQNTVFGRSSSGTGNSEQVSFADVIDLGLGLADGDFTNTAVPTDTGFPGNALIQLESGVYGITAISESGTANTIVRRGSDGSVDGEIIKVAGSNTLTVSASTISFRTPGGATVFSAAGSVSGDLVTRYPGNVDIGLTNLATQSDFQSGSPLSDEGWLGVDWIYSSFIEAIGERDGNSTGISLGANTGFPSSANNAIAIISDGEERLVVTPNAVSVKDNLIIDNDLSVSGDTVLGEDDNDDVIVNATLEFSSSGRIGSTVLPDLNGQYNIGNNGARFDVVYANVFNGVATEAKYADLAEKYTADDKYEAGTVLIFGGEAEVTVTATKGDTKCAGVVSSDPAYLMNKDLESQHVATVALQGRVPCKVLGRIEKGDLLVTSAIPGYAVATKDPKVGSVIGKSLENKNTDGKAVIEIVVGRD